MTIEYQVVKQKGRTQDNPEIKVLERFNEREKAKEKLRKIESKSNEYVGIKTLNKVNMAKGLTSVTKSDLEKVLDNPQTENAAMKFYREYEEGERSEESLVQEIQRLRDMVKA